MKLLIAYSGGLDSHVLLHVLSSLSPHVAIRAVHLNHGLHPNAAQWEQHAQKVCVDLQIKFLSHALALNIPKGESLEAVARHARYDYFASILEKDEVLCTAHHQDDQLETVLLQLMRGAGPQGLAAMPKLKAFANGYHARPLLSFSREDILHYARIHQLHWIEDDSNQNIAFDRNYLRHQIIPLLQTRFPKAAHTVARSAEHCGSAHRLLTEYLSDELMHFQGDFPNTLSRSRLAGFSAEKQAYLLRTFIEQKHIPVPSTAQLLQIQALLTARNDAASCVTWRSHCARFYRDNLFIAHIDFFKPAKALELCWDGKSPLELPDGCLRAEQDGSGPSIFEKPVTVSFRVPSHRLKKIFQEAGIPPWQRWQLPCIYRDNELLAVAHVFIAQGYHDRIYYTLS